MTPNDHAQAAADILLRAIHRRLDTYCAACRARFDAGADLFGVPCAAGPCPDALRPDFTEDDLRKRPRYRGARLTPRRSAAGVRPSAG